MKTRASKSIVFIGKSMLWSLLLYVVMMTTLNWEDVRNTINGRNAVTIVTNAVPPASAGEPALEPANISAGRSTLENMITLLSGIAKAVAHPGIFSN